MALADLAGLAERGLVPDPLIRLAIRRLLRERLAELAALPDDEAFVETLREGRLAVSPEAANAQHYEVDPELFRQVLGPRLKYSCALFPSAQTTLEEAEERMLELSAERAGLADGQRILELGCGWGSLTLWMAERHPNSRITAVSNSKPQREFILGRCQEQGLRNVEVLTADVSELDLGARPPFDRVVSVEMFEHMRNWEGLLRRIAGWLAPDGRLFVHVFCHRERAYPYEVRSPGDWMARHFFTGGIMPSDRLLYRFGDALQVARHWRLGGLHYQRTCDGWLARLDARRDQVRPALVRSYGASDADRWHQRWRLFFLACSELFGYRGGSEWGVSHYLLQRPG